jgi:hypothetical protein
MHTKFSLGIVKIKDQLKDLRSHGKNVILLKQSKCAWEGVNWINLAQYGDK